MPESNKKSLYNMKSLKTFSVVRGDSPVVIAGPHNGHKVPESLNIDDERPLGLHASAFDPVSPFKRHEACDWGVEALFKALQDYKSGLSHSYISSPYSRLVCDLSRCEEKAITTESSEHKTDIPSNLDLTAIEKEARLEAYYWPFHRAQEQLIAEKQERFGYAVFIDMHSFTPVWQGKKRNYHVGSLSCSDHYPQTFLTGHLEKSCNRHNLQFAPDQPYNLKKLPKYRSSAARKIESYGVWYTGLEIRNDLLIATRDIQTIAGFVHEAIEALLEQSDQVLLIEQAQKNKAC